MKTRVHALRWYELEPLAIHHMCFNKNSNQLAVARSDQSIEIWKFEHSVLYLDRSIPKSKDRSIESLLWCQNRLFSIGLNGFLVEYDLFNLQEKNSIPTSFGGCWCMVANEDETYLAVGTEDGYISLYEVNSDSDVIYRSSFKKQEGRILCLCWHNSGKYIVTGSVNSLRFWDTKKGKALQKINARSGHVEVIIQCVAITSDLQIISGDNSGRISFWDAMQGLLISSIQSHQADLLCIDLIEENGKQSFFASGVDPALVMFQRNATQKTGWIKGITRKIHTHDVRSMLRVNQYLITGGVDSYLTLSKFPPNISIKFPPVLPTSYIHVAASINCVLFQYSSRLELWRLGATNNDSDENYKSLALSSIPSKVLELLVKPNEVIVCSAISNDGKWAAFSTNLTVKIFHINMKKLSTNQPKVSLNKLRNSENLDPVVGMKFISDSSKLITLNHSGKLNIILADAERTSNFHQFEDIESKDGCHLLAVNNDGEYLAVGNHDGYVIVYSLIKYKVMCTLPKFNSQPTALEFVPKSHFLIIATQSRNVFEYDVKKDKFSEHFEKVCLASETDTQKLVPSPCIRGFTFLPDQPESFFIYDDVNLYCINRQELGRKPNKSNKWNKDTQKGVQNCSTYKHLLQFVHLQDDYTVAMQVPPIEIKKKLPPQLTQKQFGT